MGSDIREGAGCVMVAAEAAYLVGAYLAVTVALNALSIPLHAGLELILNQPREQYIATVTSRRLLKMGATHGVLQCANMQTNEGRRLQVCDGPSVLDGKPFANSRMGGLEVGQEYSIDIRGSDWVGYTLVDVLEE